MEQIEICEDSGMNFKNLLPAKNRDELRQWLLENYDKESECWVMVKRGRPVDNGTLWYIDAVEEAMCFGWIDSTIRHLDPLHRAQHFTPRKPGSAYSRPNIERLIWLDEQGMIHPKVRESVADLIRAPYVFPEDILNTIQADPVAWENYQTFPDGYKRIRIAYIDAARKRPAEFEKRLNSFIAKTQAGKRISGFGGIDKYYESK